MPAADPRFDQRVPCHLHLPGASHAGLVRNLSRSGLFVESAAGASPGASVHLALAPGVADPLHVHARVVWRAAAAPLCAAGGGGGLGLRIQYASDAWLGFVAALARAAPAREPAGAGPRFRVRLRLAGSPRTRSLLVAAAAEGEACERARQQAGAQWVVLDLEKIAREA